MVCFVSNDKYKWRESGSFKFRKKKTCFWDQMQTKTISGPLFVCIFVQMNIHFQKGHAVPLHLHLFGSIFVRNPYCPVQSLIFIYFSVRFQFVCFYLVLILWAHQMKEMYYVFISNGVQLLTDRTVLIFVCTIGNWRTKINYNRILDSFNFF